LSRKLFVFSAHCKDDGTTNSFFLLRKNFQTQGPVAQPPSPEIAHRPHDTLAHSCRVSAVERLPPFLLPETTRSSPAPAQFALGRFGQTNRAVPMYAHLRYENIGQRLLVLLAHRNRLLWCPLMPTPAPLQALRIHPMRGLPAIRALVRRSG
jgi:hypothetical protein